MCKKTALVVSVVHRVDSYSTIVSGDLGLETLKVILFFTLKAYYVIDI